MCAQHHPFCARQRVKVTNCIVRANVSVVLLTSADSAFAYLDDSEIRALTTTVIDQV